MPRELRITLPDDVYDDLQRRAGHDDISSFIAQLVGDRTWTDAELEDGYRAMAADKEREREALEWIEAEPDDALP